MSKGYEWCLRHFYGVQGTLDEYRLAQLNAIGNRVLMPVIAYLVGSSFVVILLTVRIAAMTLLFGWFIANNLVFYLAGSYVYQAVRRQGLNQIDVTSQDFVGRLRQLRRDSVRIGLRITLYMWLLTVVLAWVFDGWADVLVTLTRSKTYLVPIITGLVMAGLNYYQRRKLLNRG